VEKNIELSEVFTIDTDENRCALLFCLQLQHELDNANMLFLTANNFELVHSNLERVKPYIPYADTLIAKTKYLFLKESWLTLSKQYGTRAFSNELSALAEFSPHDIFFLHRIDLFFDKVFTKELEDVIIAFIKDIRYHNKKVIFSYNSKTATGKAFEALFADRRDISYHIEEDKSDIDGDCYSTIKTYNKFLKKDHSEICLISDSPENIALHEKIFGQQENIDFHHYTLEEIVQGDKIIADTTDIIIYNNSQIEINEKMVEYLKQNAHFSRIFLLSNKKFLRKSDVKNLQNIGVDYMAALFFDIKEYVSSIEAVIEDDFYSQKLAIVSPVGQTQEVDYDELRRRIIALEEYQVVYSKLLVPEDKINHHRVTSLIRDDDYVYYDRQKGSVTFVLLNILENNAKEILAQRLKIDKKHIIIDKTV